MLPHLDAAYNLARWLAGSAQDADDVVQEACLRALAFFDGFHGEDGRAWLLAIVRNTCYDWLRKNRRNAQLAAAVDDLDWAADTAPDPEEQQLRGADREMVRRSLDVEAHARECATCTASLRRHEAARTAVSAHAPYYTAPPELRARIERRAAAHFGLVERPGLSSWWSGRWFALAAVFAAVTLIV